MWRALAASEEFGKWFVGVTFTGAFTPGAIMHGVLTVKKHAGQPFDIRIERMEPERRFSFRWHPAAVERGVDYAGEPTTLVEFSLEESAHGTWLTLVESGFYRLPPARRAEAFGANEEGWVQQLKNLARYLGQPG